MSEKIKSMLSPLKPTKNRIIVFLIWLGIGIIADLLMQFIAYTTKFLTGRVEVGFKFYMGYDYTGITGDDLILLLVSIFLIFTKKVWQGFGFFVGWYISSVGDFYGKLNLPRPEG